jgi:hypothetical protein
MRRGKGTHLVVERNGYKGCDMRASGFWLGKPPIAALQLSVSVLYLRLMFMILLMTAAGIQSQLC